MIELKVGEKWGKGKYAKKIRDVIKLSNGWYLIKTDNSKSKQDFKVKVIFSLDPCHYMTPKHAHFAIDLYGKVCADKSKATNVLKAIYDMWRGKDINEILSEYVPLTRELPGYPLEYILKALDWILEQEDINFTSRSERKRKELTRICEQQNIQMHPGREGSYLAIALLCDIINGTHPVDALLKANLDIAPRGK